MSDNLAQQYGDYAAQVDYFYGTTPYQSLNQSFDQAILAPGCESNK